MRRICESWNLGRAGRAVFVGGVASFGFVLLFGVAEAVVAAGGSVIFERMAERVGDPKDMSMRGFFLFGLAHGLASLSCTLPVFLAVMGSGLTAGSFASGAGQFLLYGLGMTAVLVALTLALFKAGVVSRLRSVMSYVQIISAILLVVAGGYIIYYWLPVIA